MNKPDADDLSPAELERLIEIDTRLADGDSSGTVEIPARGDTPPPDPSDSSVADPSDETKGIRSLGFINQVLSSNPHCVDDLATEATMPSWFEIDGDHPARIGRHEIISRVGSGGFGVVFLARDPELDRLVALKVPRVETLIHSQTRRRFLRESKTAAQLDHPNIATVYEAGSVGPVFYIASQYCAGGSLDDYLDLVGGKLQPRVAAEIIAALSEAVEHAHRRGILHRDIKPSNILLDVEPEEVPTLSGDAGRLGRVSRLVDFGLAKNLASKDDETKSGIMLGTPAYTAPELVLERPNVGPQVDVYSLGATLYHFLTGEPPHKKGTRFETLLAAQKTDAVPPSRHVNNISRDLDAICLKALERDPKRRYETSQLLAQDLRNHLDGKPIVARRATKVESLVRWSRRNVVVTSLIAALAILAMTTTGSLVYTWRVFYSNAGSSRQLERQIDLALARRIFDQGSRVLGKAKEPDGNLAQFQVTHDGRLAAVVAHGKLELWDLEQSLKLESFAARPDVPVFVGDNTGLIFGNRDNRLELLPLSRSSIGTYTLNENEERLLDEGPLLKQRLMLCKQDHYNPDGGQLIAYHSEDSVVKIHNLATDKIVAREVDGPPACLALSPDGKLLAICLTFASRIDIVSTMSDQVIHQVRTSHPQYVDFSPDGKWMAASDGGSVLIYNRFDFKKVRTSVPLLYGSQVTFSADSRLLAAMTSHDIISIMNVNDLATLATVAIRSDEELSQIAFTKDGGKMVALTKSGLIYTWDLAWIDDGLKPLGFPASLSSTPPKVGSPK